MICYAPLENLENNLFTNCTSLREVIFVNGVRNVGDYVFSGCTNLQTVYLGKYVENIGASAFLNEDGSAAFSLEQCITDPAQMPDVDALLAAVKSDPMPEPTPEPTPEPAQPIGEEGAAFFGTWNGVSMEMDGSTFSLADCEIVMTLTLNEDGTMTLFDGEEETEGTWTVSDGVAMIDTMQAAVQADGTLRLEEDGATIVFTRDGEAAAPVIPTETEQSAAGNAADFTDRLEIKYVLDTADVEGFTMSASMLGDKEYSLVFHEDGTADFVLAGATVPGLPWTQQRIATEDGEADAFVIDYYGTPLNVILTDAGCDLNYFDSMLMHFVAE